MILPAVTALAALIAHALGFSLSHVAGMAWARPADYVVTSDMAMNLAVVAHTLGLGLAIAAGLLLQGVLA